MNFSGLLGSQLNCDLIYGQELILISWIYALDLSLYQTKANLSRAVFLLLFFSKWKGDQETILTLSSSVMYFAHITIYFYLR